MDAFIIDFHDNPLTYRRWHICSNTFVTASKISPSPNQPHSKIKTFFCLIQWLSEGGQTKTHSWVHQVQDISTFKNVSLMTLFQLCFFTNLYLYQLVWRRRIHFCQLGSTCWWIEYVFLRAHWVKSCPRCCCTLTGTRRHPSRQSISH